MMKRAFDVAASFGALLIGAPLMVVLAIAVKCDSKGPVIFAQERVGQNGEPFIIHKFRTMRVDHEGLAVSTASDARVTRIGKILRRTKLDELPQFYDVLRGRMSLVGPRPEVPAYVHEWPADLRPIILSVRPGITDPATITFRNEAEELEGAANPEQHYVRSILPRKAVTYADYVKTRSFLGDICILVRTAIAVFRE